MKRDITIDGNAGSLEILESGNGILRFGAEHRGKENMRLELTPGEIRDLAKALGMVKVRTRARVADEKRAIKQRLGEIFSEIRKEAESWDRYALGHGYLWVSYQGEFKGRTFTGKDCVGCIDGFADHQAFINRVRAAATLRMPSVKIDSVWVNLD